MSMEKKLWRREGDERVLKGEVLSISIKEKSFLFKSLIQQENSVSDDERCES